MPTPTPAFSRVQLFGDQAVETLAGLEECVARTPRITYSIVPAERYAKLLASSLPAANQVYWREIVLRAHYCAIVGTQRISRWTAAAQMAANAPNYFGLVSSLRGLLESCADTHEALADAVVNLADSHSVLKKAVAGSLEEGVFHKHLEDTLIHFTHAQRHPKGATVPITHKAKHTTAYIKALGQSADVDFGPLYEVLCQVSHPAAASLFMYTESDGAGNYRVIDECDDQLIPLFLKAHENPIRAMLLLGCLPLQYLFQVVERLAVPGIPAPVGLPKPYGFVWDDLDRRLRDNSPPSLSPY